MNNRRKISKSEKKVPVGTTMRPGCGSMVAEEEDEEEVVVVLVVVDSIDGPHEACEWVIYCILEK